MSRRRKSRPRDTPTFLWITAISIIVGFVYPWIVVAVGPDRCEETCTWAFAYSPAPVYAIAVAVVVSIRRGVVRGVAFAIAGTVLGLGAAFLAVLLLVDISGAS